MSDFIHILKVIAIWVAIQIVWAGIALFGIYSLELNPTQGQLFAWVIFPYLVMGAVSAYDTFKGDFRGI